MDRDIIKYGEFNHIGKNNDKYQLIICHTSREVNEYLTSLKFRYNGKYTKVPHYVITREGRILQLLKDQEYVEFFDNFYLNKNSIVISLENLGWLEKEPLKNYYINWIGNIYKEKVFEKKWRDYFFWQPYTEEQLKSCSYLCNLLMKKFSIDKKCIGHNTKVDGIEKYVGIVTKSNFDVNYTDVSPAFKFEEFIKYIENEQ